MNATLDSVSAAVDDLGYPACPAWCDTCLGGRAETIPASDGRPAQTIVTSRLHERVLADMTVDHGDLYRQRVAVRVLLDRCDDVGEPVEPTRIVLASDGPAALTSGEARALAAALLAAADLRDAEGAADGRMVAA
jgi:hypothetical protein